MEKKASDDVSEKVSVEIVPQTGNVSRFEYPVTTPASTIVSDSTSSAGVVVTTGELDSLVKVVDSTKETFWDITINLGVFKFRYGRKKSAPG